MIFLNEKFGKEVNNTVFTEMFSPNLVTDDPRTSFSMSKISPSGGSFHYGVHNIKEFSQLDSLGSNQPYFNQIGAHPYTSYFYGSNYASGFKALSELADNQEAIGGFKLVTEQYMKTLNKIYLKLWHESFPEDALYTPVEYAGFITNLWSSHDNNIMDHSDPLNPKLKLNTDVPGERLGNDLVNVVDRMITAGILDEEDRLDAEDAFAIPALKRSDFTFSVEEDKISFKLINPMPLYHGVETDAGKYLNNKKLFLMYTPLVSDQYFLNNSSTQQNSFGQAVYICENSGHSSASSRQAFRAYLRCRQPVRFFKAKEIAGVSKYANGIQGMGSHYFFEMGNLEDKQLAELEGNPVPDIIFDHVDKISSIDNFEFAPSTNNTVIVS